MEFRVCDHRSIRLTFNCTQSRSNGNANVVETDMSRDPLFVRKWSATHCAGKERKSQLLFVLRTTTIYIEFACVCQFANCRANRQKFLTAKWMRYDGLTWHITSMLSHCRYCCNSIDACCGAITCTGGWRLMARKIHFIYFNSLINNYANAVERALSVFCHFGIDCGRIQAGEEMLGVWTEGSERQRSRHIYCKSQWRHMYSMSCDIFNALNCGMFRFALYASHSIYKINNFVQKSENCHCDLASASASLASHMCVYKFYCFASRKSHGNEFMHCSGFCS